MGDLHIYINYAWGWFGWVVVAWVVCMVIDYVIGFCAALRAGE